MAVKLPLERGREESGHAADLDLLRELAALLEETGLTEIEIGAGAGRIRVARAPAPVAPAAPRSVAVEAPRKPEDGARPAAGPADNAHAGAVTSPMVGVVYVAPEPGARPFVSVGDEVREGETLFVVEAMKTINPIRAPRPGKVARIIAENGAPVEYGEALLILE